MVQCFWMFVKAHLRSWGISENICLSQVVTGNSDKPIINHIIILSKSLIQNSTSPLTIAYFKSRLRIDMETERYAAVMKGSLEKFSKKWGNLDRCI